MYKLIGADGKEYGPVATEQLQQWIAEGRINAQTKVLAESTTEWKALADFPIFAQALGAAAIPSLAPGTISPLPAGPRTNPMALTGMILGILSMVFACCCYGLPFNVLGIVFSIIGLSQIKKDPQREQGRGMAIAGLVLSVLSIAVAFLLFTLGVALSSSDLLKKIENL
jgi:amino acid transporter